MKEILENVSRHFTPLESLHNSYFKGEITLEDVREIVEVYTKSLLTDTSCEVFVSEPLYVENEYEAYMAFDVAIINCLTREMKSVHIETE